jgi:hypothetical protein
MQAMQTSDRLKLGSLVHAAPRALSGALPGGARAWFALATVATVSALVPSCGGVISSSPPSVPSPSIAQISNGFGQLLPYQVFALNADGVPTANLLSIRTQADLVSNLRTNNPLRPSPQFPLGAVLPSGAPGNHFFVCEFSTAIDIDSILDPSPAAQTSDGLTGAISLIGLNPTTGQTLPVRARVFVGVEEDGVRYAATYAGAAAGDPPLLGLQRWVRRDPDTGAHTAEVVDGGLPGAGFPGVGATFSGYDKLVSPNSVVFVADTDGNLATLESFPAGLQLKVRVTEAVRATSGRNLSQSGVAATTVGADTIPPEVGQTPPPVVRPAVTPGGGDVNVDPQTAIRIDFTEPIQPLSLGVLFGSTPSVSPSVLVQYGPPTSRVTMPFVVRPVSMFDFSSFELLPGYIFPGSGPSDLPCGAFNRIDVGISTNVVVDLTNANANTTGPATFFTTGEGPGLVNVPVTPDAIYAGRLGAAPGISVIDLNGFGQSTGNPEFDQTYQTFAAGRSNFPNNPNVRQQGAVLRPPLFPGTCTVNGGSSGVFTLARDSSLSDLVARAPIVNSVSDMMLGRGLDSAFNNGPAPFGCQANGGNICALTGKKRISPVLNGQTGNTMGPTQAGQFGTLLDGFENLMGWAPHPNPPPLNFPPLCITPFIGGQEPTSIDSQPNPMAGGLCTAPTCAGLTNLLTPGDYFGNPALGIPPSGLLTLEQNNFFLGPSLPQATVNLCADFQIRQQIGQYLYVLDRARREVVVLNSNRMTVIDRINVFDPTSMAMDPNVRTLAVTNQLANQVSFIDIDPRSANFNEVIQETQVGLRPRGIAWDGGNEDILVANEGENTVSIIAALSLTVRKVVRSQLNQPFEVAITQRQPCFGFSRNVYFGYILNRSGKVTVFESGPNTVNGWGYDDIVGISTETFQLPKTLQVDPVDLRGALWIVHEGPITGTTSGPLGVGAVSKFVPVSGITGQLPLNFSSLSIPQFRDIAFGVQVSLSSSAGQLSGIPVDVAFDNLRVISAITNLTTPFSAGTPILANGKAMVRGGCPAVQNASEAKYLFVAVPNAINSNGVIDVVDYAIGQRIDTNPYVSGTQSIPAPNVNILADYFRQ